ncbi:ABC transporter permease [Colwellia demingiae]|uniref:ABC transporter permease n=1 Tax=Colwellia demingiae TaxID=89401 RepID=A0A5C6QT71_9GAMM|nr:ABC transporter permease [Colwellia demingiae]TWX72079.1 ABC transporter permease [Colwellia demingiae]
MRLLQSIKNEWQLICHDAWLKALLFWMPVILAIVIWGVFSAGIARDLPIGVVDHDNSSVSRSLIRNYNASPTLAVVNHFHSMEHANTALREGSIYALVIIPNSLEKNTLLGKAPQVTAFYNSQFILIGKLINSAMLSAHGTYVAQIETFKDLASTRGNVEQAIGEALPISSQISPLFNANTHYGQFLVTAVIPAMWQIIIIATIVLVWARPLQNTSLDVWLAHLNFNDELIKLIPYVLIFWIQGIVYLSVFYGTLQWPMHGSWLLLILAQFLLVLACTSVATLFFFITLDVTRAMSLVAGFAAPAFAFMGVTFPTTDMPLLAQLWRALLPISHYINVQIQQVNYATTFSHSAGSFVALIVFISGFYMAKLLVEKRKNSSALNETKKETVEKGCN